MHANAINRIKKLEKFGSHLGLERMEELLKRLGNPEKSLRFIHVAGTNGKGSSCAYFYSVLLEAGYKAGLFISPFIEVFNERIQCGGTYISDVDLKRHTDIVMKKVNQMAEEGIQPTEFEVVTAIALSFFAQVGADPVILEVGLGGRGDSTNIMEKSLVSLITSISLDHMDRLGSTIEKIAWEKAGIIKDGCPLVTSAKNPRALKVISHEAKKKNAPFYEPLLEPYEIKEMSLEGTIFFWEGKEYSISMEGIHQVENAIGVIKALELLRVNGELDISQESLVNGLKKARQIGRFEIVSENPYVVLDGAHNEDGAKRLSETVKRLFPNKRDKTIVVTGVLADKDCEKIMDYLLEISGRFYTLTPDNPRALSGEELAQVIRGKNGESIAFESLNEALKMCYNQEDVQLIIFAGSLYLIGEVRKKILENSCAFRRA